MMTFLPFFITHAGASGELYDMNIHLFFGVETDLEKFS